MGEQEDMLYDEEGREIAEVDQEFYHSNHQPHTAQILDSEDFDEYHLAVS